MLFELLYIIESLITAFFIAMGIIGVFLYVTKPSDRSFKKELKHSGVHSKSIMENIVTKFAIDVILKTSSTNIKDYVFLKYAELRLPNNKKLHYIGILQNWYYIDPKTFDP